MSLEDFELIDIEVIDNSIIKNAFSKNYHQQAANSIDSDQNIDFIFGKKIIYHQIGNAYLRHELTLGKYVAVAANRVLVNGDAIRLVINVLLTVLKKLDYQLPEAQI